MIILPTNRPTLGHRAWPTLAEPGLFESATHDETTEIVLAGMGRAKMQRKALKFILRVTQGQIGVRISQSFVKSVNIV